MKKNFLTRTLVAALSIAVMASSFAGCSKKASSDAANTTTPTATQAAAKEPKDFTGELTFWHFNKDEGPDLAKAFMEKYPNVKVNVQITPDTDLAYQNKVTAAVRAGSGMPDVLAVESAFVKRFVNMNGCLEDLSSYDTAAATKDMIPYTVDIGKDAGGRIRALSWQACPGAVGYKRDLAKKYLGTDDPAAITEMLSTPEKILETGEKVKKASDGKVKLFVGLEDLYKVYAGSRTQPWVVDGKFTIDQKMIDFLDLAKKMRDGKMDGGIKQWTPGWSAAITDDTHMCWAIPTWGVQYIVAVNAKDQADKGRWGLATPIGYSEGGTWIGMSPQCKNKELAWEFIKFLTSNTDYLMKKAETSGDFFNNKQVIDAFSKKTDYLNKTVNQNTYAVYGPLADKVNGSLFTQYDDQIKVAYLDLLSSYLSGKIDKDTMIKNLKAKVKNDISDITVE